MSLLGVFIVVTIYSFIGFIYDYVYFTRRIKLLDDRISKLESKLV